MIEKPLLYTLRPADPAGHYYEVSLQIQKPNPQGQQLALPAWIPGSYLIRDFARHIVSLKAYSQDTELAITKTGNHTWLCAPCAGPLRLDYTVYAWDLSVRGAHFDETHAFFNGTSVFLLPAGYEKAACLLNLLPPPHTQNWKVHTSLPEATGHPDAAKRHGFGLYHAPNYDALIDHPVEMGTPQTITFKACGAIHEMVFTGIAPNLDLKRIAADTQKICEAQIRLFEPETQQAPFLDSSDRYVFMTMVTGSDYGGLEHRSSTALMIARHALPTIGGTDPGKDYRDYLGLVSHEYFHTWNVKRIKPAAFAPYQLLTENHTRLLWVFEGITSYYDDLMLIRSGVISQADYLQTLAKTITRVHQQPGRLRQSISDSSFDTWTRLYKQDENSPNALVNYYTKGALAALGLDLFIRQQSAQRHSLDDVMRLLWQRYGKPFYIGTNAAGLDEEAMPSLIQEATGVDTREFIARYIEGLDDIPLAELFATQNIQLDWKADRQTPDIGAITRPEADHLMLATVYNGSAAHQAGLSGGDRLVAMNGLRISTPESLERILKASRPGDSVTVHVFRRDELRAFTLTLAEPPANECQLSTTTTWPTA